MGVQENNRIFQIKKNSTNNCKLGIHYWEKVPGSFFGFLKGTNFAPIANAMGGPNIKPRASIPE